MSDNIISVPVHLQVFLNQILKKIDILETKTITINQAIKPGDNWFGEILEINIVKNTVEELSIIAKLAPPLQMNEECFLIRSIYKREIYMYDVVLPEFVKFQESRKLKNTFTPFARCYGTRSEEGQEIIMLENMNKSGYRLVSRQNPLDYKHVSLMMKSCAKLHAISFALRNQKPDLFEKLSAYIKKSTGVTESFLPVLINIATKILNGFEKTSKTYQELENFIKHPYYLIELIQPESAGDYAVITHGDYQTRNILFKYEDKSNLTAPTNLCILDWQLPIFGSPCLDISFVIWTCTDKKLRDQHYSELIDLYYETFCAFLCDLGSNPEKLYPRSIFENHLKKFSLFGFIASTLNVVDSSNETGSTLTTEIFDEIVNKSYFARMYENVEDFVKYGYSLSASM